MELVLEPVLTIWTPKAGRMSSINKNSVVSPDITNQQMKSH